MKEPCKHQLTRIKILKVTASCETTQLVCAECGEALKPPKTEC